MYKLLLCVRYLRTRYIALASIISVMLGVATMIVVNSVMAGFTTEMRDRIHGFLADVVVESRSKDGLADSKHLLELVQATVGDYIAAMTPTVEIPGMLTFEDFRGETYTTPVAIVGIDPSGKGEVGPLQQHLENFHPVYENGQLVREALRSRSEPLDWSLTEEALEHRRFKKELDAMYLERNGLGEFDTPIGESRGSGPETESPESTDIPEPAFYGGASGIVDAEDLLSSDAVLPPDPFGIESVTPRGPRTEPLAARVYLGEGLITYRVQDPETGLLKKVRLVRTGEDVRLTTVTAGSPPDDVSFSATVTDVFRSGMSEYDGQLVLMNLEQLQQKRGMIVDGVDAITSIQIKLHNYEDAETVIRKLEAVFAPGAVTIRTWESKQGLLLSAVEMETAILNVLLFLIITVAGFGILAIFFMIVVEKTRDIGILKSLGASSRGVMSIFLSYGLALGLVGSVAGVSIGLVFVRYINQIEDGLSWLTGRKVFDEEIYYFSSIPTRVSPAMVLWVASGAVAIAVLASVLPARRASRLHPVRALRFE